MSKHTDAGVSHTPGPWTVELDVVNNGDINIMAAEMLPIALIDVREYPEDMGSIPREVALANARLVAAAPELLEELKLARLIYAVIAVKENHTKTKQALARVDALITKAEGAQ